MSKFFINGTRLNLDEFIMVRDKYNTGVCRMEVFNGNTNLNIPEIYGQSLYVIVEELKSQQKEIKSSEINSEYIDRETGLVKLTIKNLRQENPVLAELDKALYVYKSDEGVVVIIEDKYIAD